MTTRTVPIRQTEDVRANPAFDLWINLIADLIVAEVSRDLQATSDLANRPGTTNGSGGAA